MGGRAPCINAIKGGHGFLLVSIMVNSAELNSLHIQIRVIYSVERVLIYRVF